MILLKKLKKLVRKVVEARGYMCVDIALFGLEWVD